MRIIDIFCGIKENNAPKIEHRPNHYPTPSTYASSSPYDHVHSKHSCRGRPFLEVVNGSQCIVKMRTVPLV